MIKMMKHCFKKIMRQKKQIYEAYEKAKRVYVEVLILYKNGFFPSKSQKKVMGVTLRTSKRMKEEQEMRGTKLREFCV